MEKRNCWLLVITALFGFVFSETALAFVFVTDSATAYLSNSKVPNTLGDITSGASGGASVKANGTPTSMLQDKVKISSVRVGSGISSREFTVQIGINNSWKNSASSNGRCVYYTADCNTSQHQSRDNEPTVPVYVRLKRNSSNVYTAIPSGTFIARVTLTQYSVSEPNGGAVAYLDFYTSGEITPVIPTCDVKNFDNNVTLPDVRRADLVNHGAGRYTGVTKEFNINLACENKPKVSVKFNGDKMPGITSEDVLVNKLSGNDNIGIQLVHNNNAMKIGENIELLSAAADSENLKFNAYYYYKGGTVQSGSIKANSEFTFTYQ
ncbi:fimbrial protein [Phytobacter diazotrophicus]|uniref:fimbrial protein n=1 Tax=Phytobacter diazotrophicus TaxID=395631 RepID=UPI0013EC8957